MRYSPSGKPLCCRCRRVATHRVPYRSKNDAGQYEIGHVYHCQAHTHEELGEPLPPIASLAMPVIGMYDVVRYRGCLYRVVGRGQSQSHITDLWLHRIGVKNEVHDISICLSPYEPHVTVVKSWS